MDCETLGVRGNQYEVPPSHEQQELWSLRSDVLERESKWTNFVRVFKFFKHDYVANDNKVGQVSKKLICNEIAWNKVCKSPYHQRCC